MGEAWRDIPGTGGMYQASDSGRIRSHKTGHYHVMKAKHNRMTGYDYVILHLSSGPVTRSIHRLVASAFLENPGCLPEVNHINEDKTDNRPSNLEWVSSRANNEHSKWKRQKPVEMFTVDGEYLATFASGAIAANLLGVGKSRICSVLKNEGTTCKGFIFKYGKGKPNEYPGLDTRRAGKR